MRPLEMVTLFFLLATLLGVWLGQRQRWTAYLPWAAAVAAALHLAVEHYRWQMAPAYLLLTLLLFWSLWRLVRPGSPLRYWVALAGSLLGVLLWAAALGLSLIFPIPKLPVAGGPYHVGTVTYWLRDETRAEVYSAAADDRRELVVQIWYPAERTGDGQALFLPDLDVAGPALAERFDLPSFLFDHINLVETGVYVEAPPAGTGPFPLLIFSHGLRGLRGQNSTLMRELASHGYVIASMDHTYGNVLTVFPDGRVVLYDGGRVFPEGETTVQSGQRLVDTWAADVRFFLDEATTWNEGEHLLAGMLDLDRIGTLGHSTGGGTAIEACALITACGAVVALDAWIEPVDEKIVDEGLAAPILFLRAPEWLSVENREQGARLYETSAAGSRLVTIPETAHFDYSDLPLLSPLAPTLGLSGRSDTHQVLAIVNNSTRAFFDWHLKGDERAWEALNYGVIVD